MDVSVIIVNYNTKNLLLDNGSTDGSFEAVSSRFPSVIWIANNRNLGFGAANNRALERAEGKYILYLNSDTAVVNNAVKLFFDWFETNGETENAGVIGCNLTDANGNTIHSCGAFPSVGREIKNNFHDLLRSVKCSIPVLRNGHFGSEPPAQKRVCGAVDYVTGADMFLRNDSYAMFDERYFLYYEDTDLQKTLSLSGRRNFIIDGPEIIHLKGQSGKTSSVLDFYRSLSKIHTQLSACIFEHKFNRHPVRRFLLKTIENVEKAW